MLDRGKGWIVCTFCLLLGAVPYFRSAYRSMRIRILQFSAKRLWIWHFFFPFFHSSIFLTILLGSGTLLNRAEVDRVQKHVSQFFPILWRPSSDPHFQCGSGSRRGKFLMINEDLRNPRTLFFWGGGGCCFDLYPVFISCEFRSISGFWQTFQIFLKLEITSLSLLFAFIICFSCFTIKPSVPRISLKCSDLQTFLDI